MRELKSVMPNLKWLIALLAVIVLGGCSGGAAGGVGQKPENPQAKPGAVTVEVGYLNHPPLRSVLADVDEILAEYGDKVNVKRYDFDTPEGGKFAVAKNLTDHTPLAIFINGTMAFNLDGRTVKFYSFPTGGGPAFPEGWVPPSGVSDGNWSMADFHTVLTQVTGANP